MKIIRKAVLVIFAVLVTMLTLFMPSKVRDECEIARVGRGLPVNFIDQDLSMNFIFNKGDYPAWVGARLPQEYPFVEISYTALVFDLVFWIVILYFIAKFFSGLLRPEF